MKNAIVLAMLLGACGKDAYRVPVPEHQWVNTDTNASCAIMRGGHVDVIERGSVQTKVIYYSGKIGPTECESGAIFMVDNEYFDRWSAMCAEIKATEKMEKDAVADALFQLVPAGYNWKSFALVEKSGWVTVKNVAEVRSSNYSFSYGDMCMVEQDGELRTIGNFQGVPIVQYRFPLDGMWVGGTQCPDDIVFFNQKDGKSEESEF